LDTDTVVGQTLRSRDNAVTFSAFQLYEWHTTQQAPGKPGDTINLDYSLIRTFAFAKGPTRLQVSLVGASSMTRQRRVGNQRGSIRERPASMRSGS
jgi:hypothetical protein